MKKIKTNIKGLIILKGKTFYDARGFLRETFKNKIKYMMQQLFQIIVRDFYLKQILSYYVNLIKMF